MSLPIFGNCACDHSQSQGENCPIIREFKRPKEAQDAYHRLLQNRSAMGSAVDVRHRLQKLGVPADNILAIQQPTQTVALGFAKRFLTSPRDLIRFLVLAGPHGCGKSTAATYVLADAVRQHVPNTGASGGKTREPFFWVHAGEVTAETDFGRVNPDWLENLRRARLLVLDDLGKDATTPGLAALSTLLTARYELRLPTVLTTNLSPEALQQRYGQSFLDRVKSSALVPDLRQEKSLRRRA